MDLDSAALDRLVRELELTRQEMAELTDALRLQTFRTEELTKATNRLNYTIVEHRGKGFWRRMVGR